MLEPKETYICTHTGKSKSIHVSLVLLFMDWSEMSPDLLMALVLQEK